MGWYTEWRELKSREIDKTCTCGKQHNFIPEDAKVGEWGMFWNCECKSTLFWPNAEMRKKLDEDKKRAA
jgi:hypothetical protein